MTGLGGEERRDEGRPDAAGCGGPGRRGCALGERKPGGWGGHVFRTQPCPSTSLFLTSAFSADLFSFFRSLGSSSHTSTRWPVRIKIKALKASSCQTICVWLPHLGFPTCIMRENLPGASTPGVWTRKQRSPCPLSLKLDFFSSSFKF